MKTRRKDFDTYQTRCKRLAFYRKVLAEHNAHRARFPNSGLDFIGEMWEDRLKETVRRIEASGFPVPPNNASEHAGNVPF